MNSLLWNTYSEGIEEKEVDMGTEKKKILIQHADEEPAQTQRQENWSSLAL